MLNYLNNNLVLIKEYQNLYSNEIIIDRLIGKFRTEEIIIHNGFDYGRFRVFIDSCLLLLNKEKLSNFYKDSYSFKAFISGVENDIELKEYLKFINNERLNSDITDICLYRSLENKKKTPWDQVMTIRNSMAHMQYGNFSSQENGTLIFYLLYNKDKGIRKDLGIIFEPILHKLVHCFFNNYSSGLLFKNTFFSKYSFQRGKKKWRKYYFYEVMPKMVGMKQYNGYNDVLMSELAHIIKEPTQLFPFLKMKEEMLNINEKELSEIINLRKYKKIAKKLKLQTDEEYFYGLKTFLDFETELSNFLVHISQLNNILYAYCTKRDSKEITQDELKEYKKQLEVALQELREDENAKLSFRIGFVYLYAMNFVLRTEDDDYGKLQYEELNVSMFKYQHENWDKYRKQNELKNCLLQQYIVERMRNSLMHGRVGISLNDRGKIDIVFQDKFNNRNEIIAVTLEDMENFLEQQCLYTGIPKKTLVLLAQQTRKLKNYSK